MMKRGIDKWKTACELQLWTLYMYTREIILIKKQIKKKGESTTHSLSLSFLSYLKLHKIQAILLNRELPLKYSLLTGSEYHADDGSCCG